MIGLSEGNGHPFSFSAIINGYDREAFARSGWPGILDYLERQPKTAFGFPGVEVTHAWNQDADVTARLCEACKVSNGVSSFEEMIGAVDAVIVARDDWRTHVKFAKPFLDRAIPVFVDKPLSLDAQQLAYFEPHLRAGSLMTTAGMRYARELDSLRDHPEALGEMRYVSATVLNDLERYGIHMLDAIDGMGLPAVRRVTRLAAAHESFTLTLIDGTVVALNCLGAVAKTFHLSLFGSKGHAHVDLHDNFTAFRRTLKAFLDMVATRRPPIPPETIVRTMHLIAAAQRLAPNQSWEVPA
jgi:predicted dehydrogenase